MCLGLKAARGMHMRSSRPPQLWSRLYRDVAGKKGLSADAPPGLRAVSVQHPCRTGARISLARSTGFASRSYPTRIFYCRETSTDYAGTVPRFPSEVGGGFLPRHLTQLFGTAQRCDRSDELFLLRKEFDWRDPLRLATARFALWHRRAAVARYGYRRT